MMVLKKVILLFGIFILIVGYVSASIVSYYSYRQTADSMKNSLLLLNTKIKELELESERLDRLKRAMMPNIIAEADKKSEASLKSNKVSGFSTASQAAFSPLIQTPQTAVSTAPKKTVKVVTRKVQNPTQNQAAATQPTQIQPIATQPDPTSTIPTTTIPPDTTTTIPTTTTTVPPTTTTTTTTTIPTTTTTTVVGGAS